MSSFDATHATSDLPALDDRLAEPGTRYEILHGELIYVPPADAPHGSRHAKLDHLLGAHAADGFIVAIDMLTRTSKTSDIAPDVSVYPAAPHPVTGGRQLMHLAFEVVSTQSLGNAGDKAAELVARGVRRVFAIDVERSRALEWSAALGTWSLLESTGRITDPALAVPLPIQDMLTSAQADDAMARALIHKRNPEIQAVRAHDRAEGREEGRKEGRAEGVAEAFLEMLAARGVPVSPATRARILGVQDLEHLKRWIARTATCTRVDDVVRVLETETPDSSQSPRLADDKA